RGHPGAAKFLRKLNAHQAEFSQLRQQASGKLLRLVPLAHMRSQFCFSELADAPAQQLLLGCEVEVQSLDRIIRIMRLRRVLPLVCLLLAASSRSAFADGTLFLGTVTKPASHSTRGFAVGAGF